MIAAEKRFVRKTGVRYRAMAGLLVRLAAFALLWGVSPAFAQEESPDIKAAREQYTVAHAKGQQSFPVVGKVIGTTMVKSGYSRKNAFILEDYAEPAARIVVYTNANVPPSDKLVFVRGQLTAQKVPANDRENYSLFLAEGAKEGMPSEGGGAVSGGDSKSGGFDMEKNRGLLLGIGALVIGGIALFMGLMQRGGPKTRKEQEPLVNPLELSETHAAEDMRQYSSGAANAPSGYPPAVQQPTPQSQQSSYPAVQGQAYTPPPQPDSRPAGIGGIPLAQDSLQRPLQDHRLQQDSYSPQNNPALSAGMPSAPGPVVQSPVNPVSVPGAGSGSTPVFGQQNGPPESGTLFDPSSVYASSESTDSVSERGETFSVLPAYFEVISGGAETPGTKKMLFSAGGRLVFDIARPANGQDQIANFIPIKSALVSRNADSQGKVIHDTARRGYVLRNLADPSQRKNPIKVGGVAMAPGEERILTDGDLIQVGDVTLRFHRE